MPDIRDLDLRGEGADVVTSIVAMDSYAQAVNAKSPGHIWINAKQAKALESAIRGMARRAKLPAERTPRVNDLTFKGIPIAVQATKIEGFRPTWNQNVLGERK